MATKQQQVISVVLKDKHSVNLYDVLRNNAYMKNVFITSGEIIGAPVVTGDVCTITCLEKGRTCVRTYNMPKFTFRSIFYPN